jgi:ABC-type Fe3+ transport system permease subunit
MIHSRFKAGLVGAGALAAHAGAAGGGDGQLVAAAARGLGTPARLRLACGAEKHAVDGAGCGYGGYLAGCVARLADGDVRISFASIFCLGAGAALGLALLRAGFGHGGAAGLQRHRANVLAAAWLVRRCMLPSIRSITGAIVVFGLVLYPYVYLLARQAFITQGRRAMEAAQTLGMPRSTAFFKVALPMARPWWAAGITLALMEMLADFGTVAIFNVDTFTTAIYKAWLNLFNLPAASQLASLLAVTVLLLVWLEQRARGQRLYTVTGATARASQQERIVLRGAAAAMAFIGCTLVLLFAFIFPVLQLLQWALAVAPSDWDTRYWGFIGHSLLLAALAALLVVAAGLWMAYAQRQHPGRLTQGWVRLSTLGYALPGMLLSVGLFVPVAWLDLQLMPLWQSWGVTPAPVIKGTLAVMLLALSARFMAVGYEPMQAAMQRITSHQEQAARSLGLNRWQTLRRCICRCCALAGWARACWCLWR